MHSVGVVAGTGGEAAVGGVGGGGEVGVGVGVGGEAVGAVVCVGGGAREAVGGEAGVALGADAEAVAGFDSWAGLGADADGGADDFVTGGMCQWCGFLFVFFWDWDCRGFMGGDEERDGDVITLRRRGIWWDPSLSGGCRGRRSRRRSG